MAAELNPDVIILNPGQSVAIEAIVRDEHGADITGDVTLTHWYTLPQQDNSFVFSKSGDSKTATITASGYPGEVTVTYAIGELSRSIKIVLKGEVSAGEIDLSATVS